MNIIFNLVISPNLYVYAESKQTDTAGGTIQTEGVKNLDNNHDPRFDYRPNGGQKFPTELPPNGVDSMVVIDQAVLHVDDETSKPVTPVAKTFHELCEALAKVDFGWTYLPSGGNPGAHRLFLGGGLLYRR